MQLKLNSDFFDYYDSVFDEDGLEFRRVTTDGPNRKQMFYLFKRLGLQTPLFGNYQDFVNNIYAGQVVIHKNINSHIGQDKELKYFGLLTEEDRQCFLVEYIYHPLTILFDYKGLSTRYLFVGNRCFKMRYTSDNDWRSNCGNSWVSDFDMVVPIPIYRSRIPYPMFAIDFVGDDMELKAIDFNVAPGIPKEFLNKYMSPTQIYLELKSWYKDYCNG